MNCFTFRCTCGNCSCGLLANISECYCCKKLEGCCEALKSDLVKGDLQDAKELNCITEHPGFRPICLEKWSLRLAGGKYCTKNKQAYKKTGSVYSVTWIYEKIGSIKKKTSRFVKINCCEKLKMESILGKYKICISLVFILKFHTAEVLMIYY